jgi:hypothetical protein
MKQVFSKIAKIGEEVRSSEPMKVEFAETAADIISDIRRFSLASPLGLASQAQKMLKEASDQALYTSEIYEKRLERAKKMISIGDQYGLPVEDIKQIVPLAQKNIESAKKLYKLLNDAQGRILTAY